MCIPGPGSLYCIRSRTRECMERHTEVLAELIARITKKTPAEGPNATGIPGVELYRESHPHALKPLLYEPVFVFVAQGKKRSVLDNVAYEYDAGHFLATLAPVPVECAIVEASEEEPLLAIAVLIDRQRMINVLMKMEQADHSLVHHEGTDPSGIFTAPMSAPLLDALQRLVRSLNNAAEAAIVGEAIIDEIYFRILLHERGGALPSLLQQRGQIQQIARAVEYVHRNLSAAVAVDDLAALVHMSSSAFHKKFKEVMHLSPLQYAKRIKLNRAHAHIRGGMSVSEAGYLVGYNSPAQFSREYKRHFGVAPSAERASA